MPQMIREVMTIEPVVCKATSTLADAAKAMRDRAVRLMRDHAIRRLPVMEDGRPVGIVSLGDLAIERDRDSALADISAVPPSE